MGDAHQGGSHHPGTPGKDAAADTAAVVHQKGLEGAEEQHAHQVAQVGQGAQQHQVGGPEKAPVVQRAEGQVDGQPHGGHLQGTPVLLPDSLLQRGPVIAGGRFKAAGVLLHTSGGQAAFGVELDRHGAEHPQPQQGQGPQGGPERGGEVQSLRGQQPDRPHQQKNGQPEDKFPQIPAGHGRGRNEQ